MQFLGLEVTAEPNILNYIETNFHGVPSRVKNCFLIEEAL